MSFEEEKVGLYYGLSENEYHSLKIPSNSSLKKIEKAPAFFDVDYLRSTAEIHSQAFQLGKAFEIMVLEPEKENFIRSFKTAGYTTKEALSCYHSEPDKVWISENDIQLVSNWSASYLKKFGFSEKTKKQVSGIVELDSVKIKFRCDEVDFENGVIYDAKLMSDASYREFRYSVRKFGYDFQAGLYITAMNELAPLLDGSWRFKFRCQEKHHYGIDARFTAEYEANVNFDNFDSRLLGLLAKYKESLKYGFRGYEKRQIKC